MRVEAAPPVQWNERIQQDHVSQASVWRAFRRSPLDGLASRIGALAEQFAGMRKAITAVGVESLTMGFKRPSAGGSTVRPSPAAAVPS